MTYSLIIHGGAGEVADKSIVLDTIKEVVASGEEMLKNGATAMDVVEHCVSLLEDSEYFNAGKGSVLDARGNVEMDAAIMDGSDLSAGSVAGVHLIKNPVQLARKVITNSEHVMLIGAGADEFAAEQGVTTETLEYFITDSRKKQLEDAQKAGKVVLDHSDTERKYGTVGAVALDSHGNIAAATSTGGIVNKKYGRVGDSPLIGCGTYADNESCGVSATGYGEQFIRTTMARSVANYVEFENANAQEAADKAIKRLVEKVQGLGGVIVVDRHGNIGKAYSTPGMIYGYVQEGDDIITGLQ